LTKDACHWKFLKNADKFLNNLKIHNKSEKHPPCIKGWRENINALKFLYEELNTIFYRIFTNQKVNSRLH